MRRALITTASAIALLAGSSRAASAEQPANARASCVGVITSYEGSQLAPGAVGREVSTLARTSPGLGATLVSPLAHDHLGSIELCRQVEG
jgi:uncharacterized membrane protein